MQRYVKEKTGKLLPIQEVREWLKGQPAYSLHVPVRRKFKTNRTVVYTLNEQFQADLADMGSIESFNNGYKFLLTCIDIFSKYAWAIPLKNKNAHSVRAAFEKIFAERTPVKLQTDQGKEFENALCQRLFKQRGIKHFNALSSDAKCAVVERFNRTLKTKMWKYFTHNNTYRYIDVLDDLMYSYNHTWHSSIKMKPVEVNETNTAEVWQNLYGKKANPKKTFRSRNDDGTFKNTPEVAEEGEQKEVPVPVRYKFNVGDHVRLSGTKVTFRKGYENGWTEEVHTISRRHGRDPPVYNVKDEAGEEIRGVFYEHELQAVTQPEWYVIEDIMETRGTGKKREYLVKYRGYPDSFNSWVPCSQVRDL